MPLNQRKLKVVSVESRKGGVGKTTAALFLAKKLLKGGQAVLLFDLDIAGTSAAEALKPLKGREMWKNLQVLESLNLQVLE